MPSNSSQHVNIQKKRYAYGTIEIGEGDTLKILQERSNNMRRNQQLNQQSTVPDLQITG